MDSIVKASIFVDQVLQEITANSNVSPAHNYFVLE